MPQTHRNNGLDTLRALAITLVFMYHYQVFVSGQPTFGWASTVGWTGVDLFFVLSGYLIGNQLLSGLARGQKLSLKAFYARRFLRTLPNFYVVLALFFLFPAAMGGNPPPPLWRFLSFTQNLWLTPGTAFSHAWSLCVEEQFYLLLPLAVVLGAAWRGSIRWAWAAMGVFIAGSIALRSWLWLRYGREADGAIAGYYPNVYYSSFCRFDEFLPGVAVALLKNFHRDAWHRLLRHGHAMLLAGVAAVAVMFTLVVQAYEIDGYGYGYFMTGFGYSLVAMAFALLVVAAQCPDSWLYRVRVPGAAQLALWSYAIYLTHKPIAQILRRTLKPYALSQPVLVIVITLACLAGGWLLYRVVETPFMRLRDRRFPSSFASPELPLRAGAAAVP
jgi:peptidoglycan/LPS O-acetylase OafA/YrhL